MRKLFENKAVQFDAHLQPANTEWYFDFASLAFSECFDLIDWDKWYVDTYVDANRTIIVKHKEYELCNLYIQITADPVDEDDDIWLAFDVYIDDPIRFYSFQIPK